MVSLGQYNNKGFILARDSVPGTLPSGGWGGGPRPTTFTGKRGAVIRGSNPVFRTGIAGLI